MLTIKMSLKKYSVWFLSDLRMASDHLSAELTATCNALGYYDGQKYHLEPHCTGKNTILLINR